MVRFLPVHSTCYSIFFISSLSLKFLSSLQLQTCYFPNYPTSHILFFSKFPIAPPSVLITSPFLYNIPGFSFYLTLLLIFSYRFSRSILHSFYNSPITTFLCSSTSPLFLFLVFTLFNTPAFYTPPLDFLLYALLYLFFIFPYLSSLQLQTNHLHSHDNFSTFICCLMFLFQVIFYIYLILLALHYEHTSSFYIIIVSIYTVRLD